MKFIWGLVLGLGLGVLIGLLIAPQSGEDTRAQLGEQGILLRSGNLGEELRSRATDAIAQGREAYTRTKDELGGRFNKTSSKDL